MQTTLIFYRSDHEAAEKTADAERKEGRRGQVRCIRRFNDMAEKADAVVLGGCLTRADAERVRGVYGKKVAAQNEPAIEPQQGPDEHKPEPSGAAIPEDWRDMKWFAMRALASNFTTDHVDGKEQAIAVIEAELARRG